jgi:D-alanyl-D-alanine carboxypeptidase (penicillin-binding protein 5/6)
MSHPVRILALLALLLWHSLAAAGQSVQAAARSWVLYDLSARQTLAASNPERRFEPASLTKLMTAYLVLQAIERGKLERAAMITPSAAASRAAGARMYIDERHPATVQQLLQGLVTVNANDAALALAEAVDGSETRFVERMNEQARRLDMTGTRFVNASGQPDPQHHSTAADMLRLAEALLRDFPDDRTLFAAPRFDFNGLGQTTRNRLLLRDPTVDGLMTGQTPRSGYSMVASSQRGERSMLAVIVGADSERIRGSEAQRLLNLGFTRWEVMRVGGAERQLSSVRVWKGASREVGLVLAGETLLAVPRTRSGPIQPAIEVRGLVEAPVNAGQTLGRLRLMAGGEMLAEYPLVARESVPVGGFVRRMIDTALLWLE